MGFTEEEDDVFGAEGCRKGQESGARGRRGELWSDRVGQLLVWGSRGRQAPGSQAMKEWLGLRGARPEAQPAAISALRAPPPRPGCRLEARRAPPPPAVPGCE